MARFHQTPTGNIPFTAAEELARDAEELAYAAGPSISERDAKIKQLVDRDMASPLVKTILSKPATSTAFRAALKANYILDF